MHQSIKLLLILFVSMITFPVLAEDESELPPSAIYYQFPAKPEIRIDFSRQSNGSVSILQTECTGSCC